MAETYFNTNNNMFFDLIRTISYYDRHLIKIFEKKILDKFPSDFFINWLHNIGITLTFTLEIIEKIKNRVPEMKLNFSVGGQISIDIFPKGWDKTFCLKFLQESNYEKIYFFGDRTEPGGGDYEIFCDSRVSAFSVKNYMETITILNNIK